MAYPAIIIVMMDYHRLLESKIQRKDNSRMEIKRYLNGKKIEVADLSQINFCTKELEYAMRDARMRAEKYDTSDADSSVMTNG